MTWWAWLLLGLVVGVVISAMVGFYYMDEQDKKAKDAAENAKQPEKEYAFDRYGVKFVVESKGEDGMVVASHRCGAYMLPTRCNWESVAELYPSHKEEAKARLEARKGECP